MITVYIFPKLDDQVASDSKNTHTGKCNFFFFLDEELAIILLYRKRKINVKSMAKSELIKLVLLL